MALFFFTTWSRVSLAPKTPASEGLSLRSAPMAHERTAQLSASPPMFESRFLDFFSRVHPAIPAVIFVPVVVGGVWLGIDRGLSVGTAVLLLHHRRRHLDADRVLAPPSALPLGAEVPRRRPHSLHHPRRPPRPSERRDAAGHAARRQRPPRGPLPPVSTCSSSGRPTPSRLRRVHPQVPELRLHALPPAPSRAEDQLREEAAHHHMRHHFRDHRYGFGVSSPLWDAIMGTLPAKPEGRAQARPANRDPPAKITRLGGSAPSRTAITLSAAAPCHPVAGGRPWPSRCAEAGRSAAR